MVYFFHPFNLETKEKTKELKHKQKKIDSDDEEKHFAQFFDFHLFPFVCFSIVGLTGKVK